jgi:acetaldehyde dehydrogenase/alcohol dehydrogenase
VFSDVEPDPTLATVERAMGDLNSFRPDVIIAVGGGSPMDAAKLMWLMYEHPEISFMDVAARFMVRSLSWGEGALVGAWPGSA